MQCHVVGDSHTKDKLADAGALMLLTCVGILRVWRIPGHMRTDYVTLKRHRPAYWIRIDTRTLTSVKESRCRWQSLDTFHVCEAEK